MPGAIRVSSRNRLQSGRAGNVTRGEDGEIFGNLDIANNVDIPLVKKEWIACRLDCAQLQLFALRQKFDLARVRTNRSCDLSHVGLDPTAR